MKKIPTLFKREFKDHKVIGILPEFTDERCKEAFLKGIPTVKYDGSCCAIIDGKFYKRYDAKKGKQVPENAIKCQEEADPVTGHLPCWVPVSQDDPADKWFINALCNTEAENLLYYAIFPNGTYEAIGPHFQGNPYGLEKEKLIPHGRIIADDFHPAIHCNACFADCDCIEILDYVRKYLEEHPMEGIVFWLDNEPVCKIKRTDFGLKWPV